MIAVLDTCTRVLVMSFPSWKAFAPFVFLQYLTPAIATSRNITASQNQSKMERVLFARLELFCKFHSLRVMFANDKKDEHHIHNILYWLYDRDIGSVQ